MNTEFQKVSDLALLAYLHSNGFSSDRTDRGDPKRIEFLFQSSPKIEKLINHFWNGEALVEPYTFLQAVKRIKSQIYS